MDGPHCVYPSIHQWPLGLLSPLAIVNNAATNMGVPISLQDPSFSSWGLYPEVELLDHVVTLFLTF